MSSSKKAGKSKPSARRRSSQEVAQLYSGAGKTFRVKSLGNDKIGEFRGDAVPTDCMRQIRAQSARAGGARSKASITLQLKGITVVDEKAKCVVLSVPVERMKLVCHDPADTSVFAVVVQQQGSTELRLHAFQAEQKTAVSFVRSTNELFQVLYRIMKARREQQQQPQEQRPRPQTQQALPTNTQASSKPATDPDQPVTLGFGIPPPPPSYTSVAALLPPPPLAIPAPRPVMTTRVKPLLPGALPRRQSNSQPPQNEELPSYSDITGIPVQGDSGSTGIPEQQPVAEVVSSSRSHNAPDSSESISGQPQATAATATAATAAIGGSLQSQHSQPSLESATQTSQAEGRGGGASVVSEGASGFEGGAEENIYQVPRSIPAPTQRPTTEQERKEAVWNEWSALESELQTLAVELGMDGAAAAAAPMETFPLTPFDTNEEFSADPFGGSFFDHSFDSPSKFQGQAQASGTGDDAFLDVLLADPLAGVLPPPPTSDSELLFFASFDPPVDASTGSGSAVLSPPSATLFTSTPDTQPATAQTDALFASFDSAPVTSPPPAQPPITAALFTSPPTHSLSNQQADFANFDSAAFNTPSTSSAAATASPPRLPPPPNAAAAAARSPRRLSQTGLTSATVLPPPTAVSSQSLQPPPPTIVSAIECPTPVVMSPSIPLPTGVVSPTTFPPPPTSMTPAKRPAPVVMSPSVPPPPASAKRPAPVVLSPSVPAPAAAAAAAKLPPPLPPRPQITSSPVKPGAARPRPRASIDASSTALLPPPLVYADPFSSHSSPALEQQQPGFAAFDNISADLSSTLDMSNPLYQSTSSAATLVHTTDPPTPFHLPAMDASFTSPVSDSQLPPPGNAFNIDFDSPIVFQSGSSSPQQRASVSTLTPPVSPQRLSAGGGGGGDPFAALIPLALTPLKDRDLPPSEPLPPLPPDPDAPEPTSPKLTLNEIAKIQIAFEDPLVRKPSSAEQHSFQDDFSSETPHTANWTAF